MLDEIVIYQPQKSTAFGHAACRRNKGLAWNETVKFLRKFTNYELCEWINPEISFRDREEIDGPRLSPESFLSIRNILGNPQNDNNLIKNWIVPKAKLDTVIEFALSKRKTKPIDPLDLHFGYAFNWKKYLALEKELNNFYNVDRLHHSSLSIYISHNIFFQPDFCFPFPNRIGQDQ